MALANLPTILWTSQEIKPPRPSPKFRLPVVCWSLNKPPKETRPSLSPARQAVLFQTLERKWSSLFLQEWGWTGARPG